MQLYNTVWKTIIYVNLREEDMEVNSVGTYIDHVERLCNSVEVKNWTGCAQFKGSVADRFRHLKRSEGLVAEIIGDDSDNPRRKRELLNFVGGN